MELSLLSFTMGADAAQKMLDADMLCTIIRENGIRFLDLIDVEIPPYGEEALKSAMERQGVSCDCLITAASFYDAPERVESQLRTACELARRLGAGNLMVIPGTTGWDRGACRGMSRQQLLDRAVEQFTLAVRVGGEYGMQVCFENTPVDYKPLSAAADCRQILDRVPGLGFVFDTANFRVADTNSDELAAYELLKDRIVRIHVKDVAVGAFDIGEACVDGQKILAVTTGSGIIPIKSLLQRLRDDGYSGVLAIEYSAKAGIHGMAHAQWIAPYVRYINAVLDGSLTRPPYARIAGIDKPVSRIFFGTAIMPMLMGENAEALLDAVLSSGINAFDCARGYGMAENALGAWIADRNNRERIVILTKCGNVDPRGKVCVNRQVIEQELTKSLEALRTDYIDLYLLHRDDPNTPVGEILECLNEAKGQGKIRAFGVSNWTHQRIEEANRYAADHGLEGFTASSPNYGLACQVKDPWGGSCVTISGPENQGAREWYRASGMPVIAYSSLGRGFFSGKFKSGDYDGAKKVLDGPSQKGYLFPENMNRLRSAEILAKRDGCSVAQIAMRYVFSSNMNLFAVVSTTNPSRLRENIQASLTPLTGEDVRFLENEHTN